MNMRACNENRGKKSREKENLILIRLLLLLFFLIQFIVCLRMCLIVWFRFSNELTIITNPIMHFVSSISILFFKILKKKHRPYIILYYIMALNCVNPFDAHIRTKISSALNHILANNFFFMVHKMEWN